MKHSFNTSRSLLEIAKAQELLETHQLADKASEALRTFVKQKRAEIPANVLSHFDRIRALGFAGIGVLVGEKCPCCNTKFPKDELDYIKASAENVGLCDNCFSFIISAEETNIDKILQNLISNNNV